MTRSIQVDDYVILSETMPFYIITKISSWRNIFIAPINDISKEYQLLLEGDKEWIFKNQKYSNVYFVDREKMPSLLFTGIQDIDLLILSNLNDKTLSNVCLVNKYANALCLNDSLWKMLLKKDSYYLQYREEGETWKQYYQILRKLNQEQESWASIIHYKRSKMLQEEDINKLQSMDPVNALITVNEAAEYGYVDALDWLRERGFPLPNRKGVRKAAKNGHINMLEWMLENDLENLIEEVGAKAAIKHGRVDVLNWMEQKKLSINVTEDDMDNAANEGHVDILELMKQWKNLWPTWVGANGAAGNGHVKVLDWLKQNSTFLPEIEGADDAARNGHIEVLDWMEREQRQYPHKSMATRALKNGYPEVAEWINSRRRDGRIK